MKYRFTENSCRFLVFVGAALKNEACMSPQAKDNYSSKRLVK